MRQDDHPPSAAHSFEAMIDGFAGRRILVVGDLMLDRFVYGDVSRISPEAPAPVLLAGRPDEFLGGAANVAMNIAALGAACDLVAVIGDDEAADAVRSALAAVPLIHPHLLTRAGVTTTKTRFVANLHNTHLLRADVEDGRPLSDELASRILAIVRDRVEHVDAVILSDYCKGVLTPAVSSGIIEAARAARTPVIVDPKGFDLNRYVGATILTPNVTELGHALGRIVPNEQAALVEAGRALIGKVGCDALLVTRSERGMIVIGADGVFEALPSMAHDVTDVSGAGDTVVAGFALALISGGGIVNAARLANAAAGVVVAKRGTAQATASELRALVLSRPTFAVESKILGGASEAATVAESWRRKGLVVGFTNGCFDLLHPGHIALLAGARGLCDRLIVGLNSDASVRRLKGATRPIQDEASRATVLAALAMVDGVVVFGEDTPVDLIACVRPDLLIKGSDYTIDQVVGRDLVEAQGGRVVLVPVVPGLSTSRIVSAINGVGERRDGADNR